MSLAPVLSIDRPAEGACLAAPFWCLWNLVSWLNLTLLLLLMPRGDPCKGVEVSLRLIRELTDAFLFYCLPNCYILPII